MRVPKPARYENKRYLDFVRTRPCCVCALPAVDAHHVDTRGAGGSDLTAVPLCREHHTAIHTVGVATFQARVEINFFRVRIELLELFIREGL